MWTASIASTTAPRHPSKRQVEGFFENVEIKNTTIWHQQKTTPTSATGQHYASAAHIPIRGMQLSRVVEVNQLSREVPASPQYR